MKFSILTLFPELFELYLSQTIIQRAVEKDIASYEVVNIRDYANNKHMQVDDTPFGGGAGMVLKPEPYFNYFKENKSSYVIFVTPQGKQLNQLKVNELSKLDDITIISGRYEGLDQRVIDKYVDEEISVGDYVLSSGDLPTLVLMDSIIRVKEGVIKKESFETDSFYNGLLGFPQYTKPNELDEIKVPEILLSGHHANIQKYRQYESIKKTYENRIDLIEKKLNEDSDFKKEYKKFLSKYNLKDEE